MFNREPKTRLPDTTDKTGDMYKQVNHNDLKRKQIMKAYGDKRFDTKVSDLKEGDFVYVKKGKTNKWTTPYKEEVYTVVRRKGNMVVVKD